MVLPFAGGVSPPVPAVFLLFSVSYPQARRSYYLFFNYLFLLLVGVTRNSEELGAKVTRNSENQCRRGDP